MNKQQAKKEARRIAAILLFDALGSEVVSEDEELCEAAACGPRGRCLCKARSVESGGMMLALPEYSLSSLDTVHHMDALTLLRGLAAGSVDCVVTSPPYYALRDYGVQGQIGLEATPQLFIERLMTVFREVRRVLKPSGTVWVNLGDSYNSGGTTSTRRTETSTLNSKLTVEQAVQYSGAFKKTINTLPEKSLMMIPARFAIAMQDEGWILRSEIVWAKRAPMPESVTDRPTKAHEMIYLFTKEPRYFYDQEAVRERASINSHGSPRINPGQKQIAMRQNLTGSLGKFNPNENNGRNMRDVWHLSPEPSTVEHFAAYPTEIPRRCILAGCPVGGIVLDMFSGTGTTAYMARKLGRHYIGCDLNRDYVEMARRRLSQSDPYQHRQIGDMRQLSMFAAP